MKTIYRFLILAVFIPLLFSCSKKEDNSQPADKSILIEGEFQSSLYAQSFIPTDDGGFILVVVESGYSLSVIKLDNDLNISWKKTLGQNFQNVRQIIQTSDKNYFIAATEGTYDDPGIAALLKIDQSGNLIFKKEFIAGFYLSYSNAMCISPEGQLLYSFTYYLDSATTQQVYAVKSRVYELNLSGDSIKSYFINGYNPDYIRQYSSNKFIYKRNGCVVMSDGSENLIWFDILHDGEDFSNFIIDPHDSIVVCNNYFDYECDLEVIKLTKYDESGNKKEYRVDPGHFSHYPSAIANIPGNQYVVAGCSSGNSGVHNWFVVKLDNLGKILSKKEYPLSNIYSKEESFKPSSIYWKNNQFICFGHKYVNGGKSGLLIYRGGF